MRFQPSERELSFSRGSVSAVQMEYGDYVELNRVGSESSLITELCSRASSDDVFFDIGANLGVVSAAVATHTGATVHSFEPNESTAAKCWETLRRNGVEPSVFEVALSDENGTGRLEAPWEHGQTAVSDDGSIEATLRRGDDFADDADLPTPTLVKIDVEGHEAAVLNGLKRTLSKQQCRTIFCEVHDERGIEVEEVSSPLRRYGFSVTEFETRKYTTMLVAEK